MTRTTEALEDVIGQLVGALSHAGQALDDAAVAVQLMASAKNEEIRAPVHVSPQVAQGTQFLVVARLKACVYSRRPSRSREYGKTVCQLRRQDDDSWLWTSRPYTNAALSLRDARRTAELYGWKIMAEDTDVSNLEPEAVTDRLQVPPEEAVEAAEVPQVTKEAEDPDGPFQRGFAAGMSTKHGLLRALADHLTKAAKGETRTSETLGEIAVIVEKELGLEQCALWPDKEVPDLSAGTRRQLSEMLTLLVLTKQGKIEINTGAQKVAARLEKALGLAEGAIWPEKLKAPNSPDVVLLEHVRRQEQLLAFIVVQLGQNMDYGARLLRHICAKYVELGFPEDIKTATFRHLDTRATFAELDTKS